MLNHHEIIQEVKKNGIVKCQDFLKKDNFEILKNILTDNLSSKGEKRSYFYRSKGKFLLKKIYDFEFLRFLDSIKLIYLAKSLKLNELATNIRGKQTKLLSIDSYFSEISNTKVLDWHVDQAYSGSLEPIKFLDPDDSCIKFFIYLTDVHSKNGCLGYVPESHKILYFLKFGILNNKIKYKPYWRLKDLRNIVKEDYYRNYLETKIEKKIIDNFIEKTSFIIDNPHDTDEYDFTMKKGGMLIFDEAGVHRGAETLLTERLVARFVYSGLNS